MMPTRRPRDVQRVLEQARERHGGRRLDDLLHPLEHHPHRADDAVFAAGPECATWREAPPSVRAESVVRRPSAIVVVAASGCSVPRARLRAASSAFAGSAPSTSMPWRSDSRRSPCPTADRRRRTARYGVEGVDRFHELERRGPLSGDDARIVKGMDQRRAGLARDASQAASRAATVGAHKRTVAPKRLTFACLTAGALSGITIHAGMPRRYAAYASAAP